MPWHSCLWCKRVLTFPRAACRVKAHPDGFPAISSHHHPKQRRPFFLYARCFSPVTAFSGSGTKWKLVKNRHFREGNSTRLRKITNTIAHCLVWQDRINTRPSTQHVCKGGSCPRSSAQGWSPAPFQTLLSHSLWWCTGREFCCPWTQTNIANPPSLPKGRPFGHLFNPPFLPKTSGFWKDPCCGLAAKSCLTLCDPMDCNPPGSSVHGISQAKILEWVAISFCRGSSQPRDQTQIPCVWGIGRWILYHCTTWEAQK